MKITKHASGKHTITMSRLEWIKIGKQLGFDMSHRDFERTFIDGFIGKFSTVLGTLKQLQSQMLNKTEINKDRVYPIIISDINYLKSLSENMPDEANNLRDMVNECLIILNKCSNSIGLNGCYNLINDAISKIERALYELKNKSFPINKTVSNPQNSSKTKPSGAYDTSDGKTEFLNSPSVSYA